MEIRNASAKHKKINRDKKPTKTFTKKKLYSDLHT